MLDIKVKKSACFPAPLRARASPDKKAVFPFTPSGRLVSKTANPFGWYVGRYSSNVISRVSARAFRSKSIINYTVEKNNNSVVSFDYVLNNYALKI